MRHISIRDLKRVRAALASYRSQRGGEQHSARSCSGAHTEMTLFTLRITHTHARTHTNTHTHTYRHAVDSDSKKTYSNSVRTFPSSRRSLFTSFEAAYGGKSNFTVFYQSIVILFFSCILFSPFFFLFLLMNPSRVKCGDAFCCHLLCTVRK